MHSENVDPCMSFTALFSWAGGAGVVSISFFHTAAIIRVCHVSGWHVSPKVPVGRMAIHGVEWKGTAMYQRNI